MLQGFHNWMRVKKIEGQTQFLSKTSIVQDRTHPSMQLRRPSARLQVCHGLYLKGWFQSHQPSCSQFQLLVLLSGKLNSHERKWANYECIMHGLLSFGLRLEMQKNLYGKYHDCIMYPTVTKVTKEVCSKPSAMRTLKSARKLGNATTCRILRQSLVPLHAFHNSGTEWLGWRIPDREVSRRPQCRCCSCYRWCKPWNGDSWRSHICDANFPGHYVLSLLHCALWCS